ncbi:MAG TPA: hypothetical protein VG826_30410 [Pirellulales bacterium]|nr:hypothetical protein [Pirellulales bacterium]
MANPFQRVMRLLLTGSVHVWGMVAVAEQSRPATEKKSPTDEGSQVGEKDAQAADLRLLTKTAGTYTIKLGEKREQTAELNEKPVFRWNNSIAGTKDAALFLWMAEGRPVAAATMLWRPELGMFHEFQSLAEGPLHAERAGKRVWDVSQSGIRWEAVPGARPPDSSAVKRLTHMKELAGRFGAEVIKGPPAYPEDSIWQLRLMVTPVARYGGRGQAVRDGAVFAFCQDTDPEILLLLEEREEGKDTAWYFAFAPMTGWWAKARLAKATVWSQPRLHPGTDPKRPYFVVGPVPRIDE